MYTSLICCIKICIIERGTEVYAGVQPVLFLSFFCLSNSLFCSHVGSTCMAYLHLDEEGHLEYIQISSSTRAFRHRRKLRMTDRHQRGILRGVSHSQQLFCAVPGVQDPLVPRSLTVHYYDGNYGAIIRINRDAHRNKPQTVLLRIARRNRDYSLWVTTTRSLPWSIGFLIPRHLSRLKFIINLQLINYLFYYFHYARIDEGLLIRN